MDTLSDRLTLALQHSGITQAELARRVGIKPPSVNGWFSGKAKHMRGENLLAAARALGVSQDWLANGRGPMTACEGETKDVGRFPYAPVSALETQRHYVRIQQLDAEAGMGGELVNDDYPEVVKSIDFTTDYIRQIIGFLPHPGRLVLVTGRGDSMMPIINPGETLIVDTGLNRFDGDGIYLINTGGGHQIKALQHRGDAVYVVSANAALYPAFPLPSDAVIGGKVYLRNKTDRLS